MKKVYVNQDERIGQTGIIVSPSEIAEIFRCFTDPDSELPTVKEVEL